MSIAKSSLQATGVTVTYWILKSLTLDTVAQVASILMNAYLDSTAYSNGNAPVTCITIQVAFIPTNPLPGGVPVLTALYNKVLTDPFFADGTFTNDGF